MADWLESLLAMAGGEPLILLVVIFVLCLALEDAATVTATMLASAGQVPVVAAWLALTCGILATDTLLYALGRLARHLPWLDRRFTGLRLARAQRFLDRNIFVTVVAARFVPGTRLLTYTGLGLMGVSARRYLPAVCVAVPAWTALLVGGGTALSALLADLFGPAWHWVLLAILIFLLVVLPWMVRQMRRRWRGPDGTRA